MDPDRYEPTGDNADSGDLAASHRCVPMAHLLDDLPRHEVESGAWHDDFLVLGHRLRVAYGNTLTLDKETPAYYVSYAGHIAVSVTCPVNVEHADSVRIASVLVAVPSQMQGIFEFALRENARVKLVRISFDGAELWVDYELPFTAAHSPALSAGVSAVGWTARRLRRELVPMLAA
jgi:hypothetical protein